MELLKEVLNKMNKRLGKKFSQIDKKTKRIPLEAFVDDCNSKIKIVKYNCSNKFKSCS